MADYFRRREAHRLFLAGVPYFDTSLVPIPRLMFLRAVSATPAMILKQHDHLRFRIAVRRDRFSKSVRQPDSYCPFRK